MMNTDDRRQANRKTLRRLGFAAVLMFGFGFALVPLYSVFCSVTGLHGKTGRIDLEQALTTRVDKSRLVTVEFLAQVDDGLPWEFRPMERRIQVHPGVVTEVHYYARNTSGRQITGQAVPSFAPGLAARYFNKTECFCFTRQTLQAKEGKDMPIRFVVDPALPEDARTVTLSYTFFLAQGSAPASKDAAESGKLDAIL